MTLEVKELVKKYGEQFAVDHISFTVSDPTVLGFLGPNGAGKSTTMKIIAGFLQASSGSVSVNGLDVVAYPLETKRLIGYLPEHNPLYQELYVGESLNFIAHVYKINKPNQRIAQVLEQVGLGEERKKKIKHLSKGYRQRLGFAQALLPDPPLLILDEPTSGLDPNQLREIRALITQLGKEKIVLLSTHIMQEVEATCREVILINKGKIATRFSLKEHADLYAGENLEDVFRRLTK